MPKEKPKTLRAITTNYTLRNVSREKIAVVLGGRWVEVLPGMEVETSSSTELSAITVATNNRVRSV
jgi:hypothetical protein